MNMVSKPLFMQVERNSNLTNVICYGTSLIRGAFYLHDIPNSCILRVLLINQETNMNTYELAKANTTTIFDKTYAERLPTIVDFIFNGGDEEVSNYIEDNTHPDR